MKTAEQEKASLELGGKVGAAELEAYKSTEVGDIGKLTSSNERYMLMTLDSVKPLGLCGYLIGNSLCVFGSSMLESNTGFS